MQSPNPKRELQCLINMVYLTEVQGDIHVLSDLPFLI